MTSDESADASYLSLFTCHSPTIEVQDEIYNYAIKLLARREHSIRRLRTRLELKFGDVPRSVIDRLVEKRYLDDRRFAETYVRGRKSWGRRRLKYELMRHGVGDTIVEGVIAAEKWPSLVEALGSKMKDLNVKPPLSVRDASRLSGSLARLGYEEEAIREELENLL